MKPVMMRGLEVGRGMPKIISPIVARTVDSILHQAEELARARYVDAVEWRADSFDCRHDEAATLCTLTALREALGEKPCIFTLRTTREGGAAEISDDAYLALIERVAASGGADAIDVEISRPNAARCVEAAHGGAVVIGSSHDFERTPPRDEIVSTLARAASLGADIPKAAVMPHSAADVLALLDATRIASEELGRPIITMSMSFGAISRLSGELFGSSMTFGSAGKSSAPGQLPAEDLSKMLAALHMCARR